MNDVKSNQILTNWIGPGIYHRFNTDFSLSFRLMTFTHFRDTQEADFFYGPLYFDPLEGINLAAVYIHDLVL